MYVMHDDGECISARNNVACRLAAVLLWPAAFYIIKWQHIFQVMPFQDGAQQCPWVYIFHMRSRMITLLGGEFCL